MAVCMALGGKTQNWHHQPMQDTWLVQSKGGPMDFISGWEELQNHTTKGMNTGQPVWWGP